MRGLVIDFLAAIGKALGTEFSPFVTDLCPYLLAVVQMDNSKDKRLTEKALNCVSAINSCLDPHLHLIVPPVIFVIDDLENTGTEPIRITAIKTLENILHYHSIGERAPMVMQMWLRNIHNKNFHEHLMKILVLIVEQVSHNFGFSWSKPYKSFEYFYENRNSPLNTNFGISKNLVLSYTICVMKLRIL